MLKKNRNSALDRILGKVDDLDEKNLAALVTRLNRERRLLETIFNAIQDTILVTDTRGVIQFANHAARALIGFGDRETGQTLLLRRLPRLADALGVEDLADIVEGSAVSTEFGIDYPEARELSAYLVPLAETTGSFDSGGFLILLSDITEARDRTREQIESERAASITMLAAGVAHELGNPLNSILIHLQLAQRSLARLNPDDASTHKIRKAVEVCRNEVDRLDSILTNFLHAVRPTDPDLREVGLWSLLNEVLGVQEELFRNRGIGVEIEIDPSLPSIIGDPNQLKQVFFNVVKNAAEAMSSGGILRVHSTVSNNEVTLRFSDEGEGIDSEDLARVFQPYFTTKEGGHGLGMMIVQRIMNEHRGSISIHSEKTRGTTVTLRFPRYSPIHPLLETHNENAQTDSPQ